MKIAISGSRSHNKRDEVLKILYSHISNYTCTFTTNINTSHVDVDNTSSSNNINKNIRDNKDNKECESDVKNIKDDKECKSEINIKDDKDFNCDVRNKHNENKIPPIILVGDCPTGVDKFVRDYCKENKIEYKVFVAKWDKYGLSAGPIRNKEMIDELSHPSVSSISNYMKFPPVPIFRLPSTSAQTSSTVNTFPPSLISTSSIIPLVPPSTSTSADKKFKDDQSDYNNNKQYDENKINILLAFPKPDSKGTINAINLAKQKGIKVYVYNL